jgi:hypothetical protein
MYKSFITILFAYVVVVNNLNYFAAGEEKPDTYTYGLGQVSHFCCYRFGMFLVFWLSHVAATVILLLYQ